MKRSLRLAATFGAISCIICGGTCSATYAWFRLAQERSFNVSGSALGTTTGFTLGFVSDVQLSNSSLVYDEELSTTKGKYVYWLEEDINVADTNLISYILTSNGYASEDIYPSTSGKHAQGEPFYLYQAPNYLCDFEAKAAPKNTYLHLSLAFKVVDMASIGQDSVVKKNVYLQDYQIGGAAKYGARLHFNSNTSQDMIVNPTADIASGDYVGGPLDLNQDGYYDFGETIVDGVKRLEEFYYGQAEENLVFGTPYQENVKTVETNYDCFNNPNQYQGIYPLTKNESYISQSFYSPLSDFIYRGVGMDNSKIVPVCQTDDKGIGYTDLDVYIEGWDKTIINSTIGTSISNSLMFIVE